ncbi:MAG: hypothetical protein PWP21_193 [Thermosediminibacterales bacterium]|nr:hypothetical protein [Thermosediminibacterales bacterium]
MIRRRTANVIKILSRKPEIEELLVNVDKKKEIAINYPGLTGPAKEGDKVILNTTAVWLGLGTGGYHFVIHNYSNSTSDISNRGHIIKLRYTPMQIKCLTVEEQKSDYHQKIREFKSLNKTPVIVGLLHSMVPYAASSVKHHTNGKARIVYVMTDGGCLPIFFSKLVFEMKKINLIDSTITTGHAFGGDYESINIYTGIIAAKEVAKADIIIVSMGPGIAGTGTEFGFSGIEQGEIINAVNVLGGIPIAIPRISFEDKRERHRGISHHTLTVLDKICHTPATVVFHKMNDKKMKYIFKQLEMKEINKKHRILIKDGRPGADYIQKTGLKVTTMGRGFDEDPEFFLTASAAGAAAVDIFDKVYN